jgi:hypothetical protein
MATTTMRFLWQRTSSPKNEIRSPPDAAWVEPVKDEEQERSCLIPIWMTESTGFVQEQVNA